MTRHLVFWETQQQRSPNGARGTIDIRQDKLNLIDFYLYSLYRNLLRHHYTVELPLCIEQNKLPLFSVVLDRNTGQRICESAENELVVFSFNWLNVVPTTIRAEFHEEYITISIVIDLSVPLPMVGVTRKGDRLVKVVRRIFERLNSAFLFGDAPDDGPYKPLHRWLYQRLWDEFDKDVFGFECKPHLLGLTLLIGQECLGKMVGDLRRVILGSNAYPIECYCGLRKYTEPKAFQPAFFQQPIAPGPLRSYYYTSSGDLDWAYSKLAMLWRFVLSADRLGGYKKDQFTAS